MRDWHISDLYEGESQIYSQFIFVIYHNYNRENLQAHHFSISLIFNAFGPAFYKFVYVLRKKVFSCPVNHAYIASFC